MGSSRQTIASLGTPDFDGKPPTGTILFSNDRNRLCLLAVRPKRGVFRGDPAVCQSYLQVLPKLRSKIGVNMRKRILPATKRAIPRPFSFEWGKGQVVEEASIKVEMSDRGWEPTVQLLRFEDGSETLRFCVFHGKQFSRMPLLIGSDELGLLFGEASRHPLIRAHLARSVKRLR